MGPFTNINLIPAWISNFVNYKVWDKITYPFPNHPFPNLNGCTVGVWEWISNFIPHFTGHMFTYPSWDLNLTIPVKSPPLQNNPYPLGNNSVTHLDIIEQKSISILSSISSGFFLVKYSDSRWHAFWKPFTCLCNAFQNQLFRYLGDVCMRAQKSLFTVMASSPRTRTRTRT